MQHDLLPCCMHPTTLLLVDDHTDRARSLSRQLARLHCRVLVFNHPQAVLDYLHKEYQPHPFTNAWNHPPDYDEATRVVVPQLYRQLYSATRFNQIAVLVTDHDLQCDIDGLQLCRRVPHTSIHKILWTRVLKADSVTDAFNDGLIGGYVFVDEEPHVDQAVDKLKTLVCHAIQKHFLSLSGFLQKDGHYYPEYKALHDPAFIRFFQQLLQQLQIVDYYLFDYTGCFVLVDAAGQDHALFVRDEVSLLASYDCAEFDQAPSSVQQQLESKSHMLCLPDIEQRSYPPGAQWTAHVRPATALAGEHGTYFCHLGKQLVHLDRDRIVAFAAHRRQHKSVEYRFC